MIKVLLILLLLCSPLYAQQDLYISDDYTDYTEDANCQLVLRFNNDSTGSDYMWDTSENNEHFKGNGGTVPLITGKEGNGRDFELGDTECISVADGGSTDISGADQAITLAAWIKMESAVAGGTEYYIFAKWNTSSNRVVRLDLNDGEILRGVLSNDGSSSTIATGATQLSAGTWYHVAMVYDDTDIRVYLNGTLDSNGSDNPKTYSSGIHNGNGHMMIGAGGNTSPSGGYFDGVIDEVIIFDRALSAAEVKEIYTRGIQ